MNLPLRVIFKESKKDCHQKTIFRDYMNTEKVSRKMASIIYKRGHTTGGTITPHHEARLGAKD
jgi:hypothetical protein